MTGALIFGIRARNFFFFQKFRLRASHSNIGVTETAPPSFLMALPTIALPGQLLGSSSQYSPGPGTHLHASQIYASLAGAPKINPAPTSTIPIVSIPRLLPSPTTSFIPSPAISNTNTLPEVGCVVLCRVTRLTTKQANVAILVVGEDVCADEWAGIVRREDVRATEKEKVVVGESFRVGDVVRGVVVCWCDFG